MQDKAPHDPAGPIEEPPTQDSEVPIEEPPTTSDIPSKEPPAGPDDVEGPIKDPRVPGQPQRKEVE